MNDIKTRASILVTCFFLMATMAITPILGVIANTFPETGPVAIQVISTLPNLFVIIFTLLAGVLATRFAKKTISLIGLFLLVIAGVGGYLFHGSVGALYFWAAIIGVGMGLFSPMVTLLINYNLKSL
jgi:MFS family permease